MKFSVLSLFGFVLLFSPVYGLAQNLSTSTTYREAYDKGYADGLKAGQEDRQQERLFDYANKKAFQRADQGFDSSRHDPEIYSVAYRRGFEDGYEDGFQLEDKTHTYRLPSSPSSRVADSSQGRGEPVAGPNRLSAGASHRLAPSLNVPSGTDIRTKLLDTLSTQRNERGDTFRAEVMEDVLVGQDVAIPTGTRISGKISSLKRAGRIKGRAEMNLSFEDLEFRDGTRAPIEATVVSIEKSGDKRIKDEEGTLQTKGTKGEDAKNVGTASAIGAVIGVLTGGKRGAKTGATIGAVAGLAGVLTGRGRDLRLYSETEMVIRLQQEAVIPARVLRSKEP